MDLNCLQSTTIMQCRRHMTPYPAPTNQGLSSTSQIAHISTGCIHPIPNLPQLLLYRLRLDPAALLSFLFLCFLFFISIYTFVSINWFIRCISKQSCIQKLKQNYCTFMSHLFRFYFMKEVLFSYFAFTIYSYKKLKSKVIFLIRRIFWCYTIRTTSHTAFVIYHGYLSPTISTPFIVLLKVIFYLTIITTYSISYFL